MSFLAPLFFVGLGALAVPILIHLIQRERRQVVVFPSLMFLRRLPYPSVQRRRIRHWFLLLMRLAALALIVTAFARPFLTSRDVVASGQTGPRELVILLDRSYSMAYGDRWARAQETARQVVDSMGAGDRATLVLFDTGAEVVVRSATDRSRVRSAIDTAAVGAGSTRYGPALKLAQSLLAASRLPLREAVLVSDFQQAGWDAADAVRFPRGFVLTPAPIGDLETSNVAVTGVTPERSTFSGQERVTLTAALANRSDDPLSDVEVVLEIGGRRVQSARVDLEAQRSTPVTFDPVTLDGLETRGVVRVAADALPADDAFHLTLSPGRSIPVLVVRRGSAPADSSFYLTQALSIGREPRFDVRVEPVERIRSADLTGGFRAGPDGGAGRGPAVVVLDDVPLGSGGIGGALPEFVAAGGGLLVVLGERARWPADAGELLPGRLGAEIERSPARGGVLDVLDYQHPVFELFESPRGGSFSTARFFRYRSLALDEAPRAEAAASGADSVPWSVLARFDDRAPALVERRVGRGLVMLWTTTLDTYWNDLALKPVFLPFVHRLTAHLARYREPDTSVRVGQVVDLDSLHRAARLPAGLPSGEDGAIELVLTPSGGRRVPESTVLEVAEPGFYEVRFRGDGVPPLTVAANVDYAESNLTPVDPQELVAAVAESTGPVVGDGEGGPAPGPTLQEAGLRPEDQERQQGVWWYLLVAGALLLAAETTVANRLSRPTA